MTSQMLSLGTWTHFAHATDKPYHHGSYITIKPVHLNNSQSKVKKYPDPMAQSLIRISTTAQHHLSSNHLYPLAPFLEHQCLPL